MVADLRAFLAKLRLVNPGVRMILTVSPVPLVATFEPRHVLVSTAYSKAALRVAAEVIASSEPEVCYFPSYEIITGPQARGRYYAEDLRSVTPEGVARVMEIFSRHFLGETATPKAAAAAPAGPSAAETARFQELAAVVCEEEALDVS